MHKRLARRSNCVAILRPFQGEKVTVGHFRCGHATPGERAVQRIAGTFAFEDRDELFLVLLEAAEHGIGDFAVHFDMAFAGKGEVTG